MSWAEDHLDSNETAVMHVSASDIDEELHYYCQGCEEKFNEPQQSPYCELCGKDREIKALKVQKAELERKVSGYEKILDGLKQMLIDRSLEAKEVSSQLFGYEHITVYKRGMYNGVEVSAKNIATSIDRWKETFL